MIAKVLCKDVFKREKFNTYSELVFSLALARECNRRGMAFSFEGMHIDFEHIPGKVSEVFWWAWKKNLIEGIDSEMLKFERTILEEPFDFRSMDWISLVGDNLFFEEGGKLIWTEKWARDHYLFENSLDEMDIFDRIGAFPLTLLSVVAKYFLDLLLGLEGRELVVRLDGFKAKSPVNYINLLQLRKENKWVCKFLTFELNDLSEKMDLEYTIFCNESDSTGKHRIYSVKEKKGILEGYGIKEGSTLVLWKRKGMNATNPFGRLISASIVVVRSIGDVSMVVDSYALAKTNEEFIEDYYDTDERVRDIELNVKKNLPCRRFELSYFGLGIEECFSTDDEYLLCKLDKTESVIKLVKVGDMTARRVMKAYDVVHWIFSQNNVDFDEEWFKKEYFGTEMPLWSLATSGSC